VKAWRGAGTGGTKATGATKIAATEERSATGTGLRGAGDRGTLAYAAAVLAIFGWGSLYPAAKLALEEVTPLMIALARAALAGILLALITCLRYGTPGAGVRRLRGEAGADWRGPCALGLIGLAGTSLLAMLAQQYLSAAVNGLLNNLSPLWLALYATATGRARKAPLLLAGSLLAAAGVALVLLGDTWGPLALAGAGAPGPPVLSAPPGPPQPLAGGGSDLALGATLAVGGSMLIAYSNLVARRVMVGRDPFATTAVAAGWGTIPLLLLLLLGIGGSLPAYGAASAQTKGLLLWLGGACTAFNFSLWYFALAHLPVTRIAHLQYLIPPLGVALSVLLLGEPAGPGLIAGTMAVVAGIVIAQQGAEPTG
jgi:drug/metabolite transporter (DMT)-like permease